MQLYNNPTHTRILFSGMAYIVEDNVVRLLDGSARMSHAYTNTEVKN